MITRINMLTLTDNANAQIKHILEGEEFKYVRAFISGGGCAGFSYGFTLDEAQNEDDFEQEYDGVKVLVDSMSWQYVQGATIHYKEDLMGASFTIDNPNASSTCGCGSSFAPY